VLSGVSAGSLNAFGLSVFEIGDEKNAFQALSDTWATITNNNLMKDWKPLGILTGLFSKSGVFDTQPLTDFFTNYWNVHGAQYKRRIAVGTTDVNTGTYTPFYENTTDPVKATIASASIPFVFPHQTFPDENLVLMDGGTVYNINLVSAVHRCREVVDDDSKIVVDIIDCFDSADLGGW
jgi:predicted acylesterase/phospholipase RssA